jgi:hypothetical protein
MGHVQIGSGEKQVRYQLRSLSTQPWHVQPHLRPFLLNFMVCMASAGIAVWCCVWAHNQPAVRTAGDDFSPVPTAGCARVSYATLPGLARSTTNPYIAPTVKTSTLTLYPDPSPPALSDSCDECLADTAARCCACQVRRVHACQLSYVTTSWPIPTEIPSYLR